MLQQILETGYIDQELKEQLTEEQKELLYRKMREEQVRKWHVREEKLEANKQKPKEIKRKIDFLLGVDGSPWVWVMGEHSDDLPYEDLVKTKEFEEAEREARVLKEEAEKLAKHETTDFLEKSNQLQETDYYEQLQLLIETTFDQSGSQRVVMVVHSLGALVSHYFLTEVVSQEWKDVYIGQYITMAAVWAGAVKVLHGVVSGETDGMFPFMTDKKIKANERSFASEYWMVPRTVRGVWPKDQVLVQSPYQNYSAYDLDSLMIDLHVQNLSSMYSGVLSAVGHELAPPNVTTLCIYSNGVDTPESYIYGENFPRGDDKKMLSGDGDGTVNINSLRSCKDWIGSQPHPVRYQELSKVEHMSTVWNPDVLKIVQQAILGTA